MKRKERVMTALRCGTPDRVPLTELYINESSIVRLAHALRPDAVDVEVVVERVGEETRQVLDLYCLVVDELELDATCGVFSIGLEPISQDRARDKFGTIFRLSEHGEPFPIKGPVQTLSDLEGFDMASKVGPDDFSGIRYVFDKMGGRTANTVCITDPFKVSWRRRGGMEPLLMDYIQNPKLVHGLARAATEFDKAAVDVALDAGADAFFMPGDVAGEFTTLMSPKHYREYIKPYHREIVEHVHDRGSLIVKHTDGNAWPIMDDIVEVGFDGFHPVQPQCMDIAEVKRHLAGRLCVLGNVDCRDLLVSGSVEEVERTVKETIEQAAPGGGYVMTSSNSIHPGCRPENYIAMVRTAHRWGAYDLESGSGDA